MKKGWRFYLYSRVRSEYSLQVQPIAMTSSSPQTKLPTVAAVITFRGRVTVQFSSSVPSLQSTCPSQRQLSNTHLFKQFSNNQSYSWQESSQCLRLTASFIMDNVKTHKSIHTGHCHSETSHVDRWYTPSHHFHRHSWAGNCSVHGWRSRPAGSAGGLLSACHPTHRGSAQPGSLRTPPHPDPFQDSPSAHHTAASGSNSLPSIPHKAPPTGSSNPWSYRLH